jgi:protein-disulfide isomerase
MARSRRGLLALALLALAVAPAATAQAPGLASGNVMAAQPGDRSIGRDDAPVTVVEYASFTCSHCAFWWRDVFPEFKVQFIDTGRARLVIRDLPTPPVEASAPAAILARCVAPEQFHDVADSLMTGRLTLQTMADVPQWLIRAGAAGGLDEAGIDACLADPANAEALDARIAAARAAGIDGTPTFLIDGFRVEQPDIAGFEAAIGTP